jgi:hypothetical protein
MEKSSHHSRCLLKAALILFLLAAALPFFPPALAHSPSEMAIAYDEAAQELVVTLTHGVPDPATHYVKEVVIRANNVPVQDVRYTSQPSKDTFAYRYSIPTKSGDTIDVTAECVLGGSITRSTAAGGASMTATAALPPPTQAAGIAVPLALVIVLALFYRNR